MKKFFAWTAGIIAALVVVAWVGLLFFQEPLRAFIEQQLNTHVEGYHFSIGKAHLYPNLSLELNDVLMKQTDHPDPPVADLPRWHFSIQWRHIFSGVLVSDYLIERPILHITLPQARKEVQDLDKVPLHQKGWRDAVYSFYPFKINEFKVVDADVTYVDRDESKPLRLTHLNFRAGNIRNIRFPNDAYPSDISFFGNIFDTGKIRLIGHANFLAEPSASINAHMELDHVPLQPLLPVTGRYNVQLTGGIISADGHLEYTAAGQTVANLKNLKIENAKVDYVHAETTAEQEQQRVRQTAETAKELQNKPETRINIEHAVIRNSDFGFVNEAATPPYRVFLSNAELSLDNISNQMDEGIGNIELKGKFMGSGDALFRGNFKPEGKSPNFDLDMKIEQTQMPSMNNLLRAYANFDVTGGLFSLYSELNVKNGEVDGYIKPLFKDLRVRKDKEKGPMHQLYTEVVGGLSRLLENRPRKEVATKTDITGDASSPKTDTWQAVKNLVVNAFFKAILPGFEREAERV